MLNDIQIFIIAFCIGIIVGMFRMAFYYNKKIRELERRLMK